MDCFIYYFCINLLCMQTAHPSQETPSFEQLAASVDNTLTQLEQRPDFGQMGWQSIKELLVTEGQVIDCLSTNMSDIYFDYVLTTRESLLDRAPPSVIELREKMIDASTFFAAERAKVISKLQTIDTCNLIYLLSRKERKQFLKYMAEMLGIYYYRADYIQNSP